MTMALCLLLRVIRRRVERGETLEAALDSYPKLTEKEREALRTAFGK